MSTAERQQTEKSQIATSLLAYVKHIHRLKSDEEAIMKLAFEAGYRMNQAGQSWTKSDAVQQYENLIRRQHFLIVKLKQQVDQRSHQSLSNLNPQSPSSTPAAPSMVGSPISGRPSASGSAAAGASFISSDPPSPVSSASDVSASLRSSRLGIITPPSMTPPDSPLATLADSALMSQTSRSSQSSIPSGLPSVAQPPRGTPTSPILPNFASTVEIAARSESQTSGKRSFSIADFEIDTERLTGAKRAKTSESARPPEFAVPFQVTPFSLLANPTIQNMPDTSPNFASRLVFPSQPALPGVNSMMPQPTRTSQTTHTLQLSQMRVAPGPPQAPQPVVVAHFPAPNPPGPGGVRSTHPSSSSFANTQISTTPFPRQTGQPPPGPRNPQGHQ